MLSWARAFWGRIYGSLFGARKGALPDPSDDELREFLSADLFDVPADPVFKEGLREKLWEAIRSGSFGYGKPGQR